MNFFLFVGACLGHAALLVVLLRRWYALPLPRLMLSAVRAFVALATVVGAVWLWILFGFDVMQAWHSGPVLAIYLSTCWIIGLGIVPSLTIIRLLRKRPQALVSNHTRTLDVAKHLGYKPIGRGKYRHLARLPWKEVFQVDFAERALQVPGLPPPWDGLSIRPLTDPPFAACPVPEFYQKCLEECRAPEPRL